MPTVNGHRAEGDASGLTRRSTGVSPASRELIKMLAAIAVEQYLREVETRDEEQR